jgi:hypothetical protein
VAFPLGDAGAAGNSRARISLKSLLKIAALPVKGWRRDLKSLNYQPANSSRGLQIESGTRTMNFAVALCFPTFLVRGCRDVSRTSERGHQVLGPHQVLEPRLAMIPPLRFDEKMGLAGSNDRATGEV